MRPWSYYQHWLDVVSRSFALCIPQLEPPFRDHVGLAYLLFRVLDTVEDAGANVRGVDLVSPDLESVFLHLTGRRLRE